MLPTPMPPVREMDMLERSHVEKFVTASSTSVDPINAMTTGFIEIVLQMHLPTQDASPPHLPL